VRYVRAVVSIAVSVRGDVMCGILVYWSNMFAGLVSGAISC
jgi:hypothetical protein